MDNKFEKISLGYNQSSLSGKNYYVYIVTNQTNNVLYTGVTNNLIKRTYQHKSKYVEGFTNKYNCNKLVYFEIHNDVNVAINREKFIKGKKRVYKLKLINEINPEWVDLYDYINS